MTDKMSWHKEKKELTEESTGDGKHGRKKRERLFKKRFSQLSLFSGSPRNKVPQGRSPAAEDKRRCAHKKGSQRPKEEPCSLRGPCSLREPCSLRGPCSPRGPCSLRGPCSPRGPCSLREQCSPREPCSPRSCRKMCPSCEIRLCRPCGTLHSQRAFIAHSLLDHYDSAALPC